MLAATTMMAATCRDWRGTMTAGHARASARAPPARPGSSAQHRSRRDAAPTTAELYFTTLRRRQHFPPGYRDAAARAPPCRGRQLAAWSIPRGRAARGALAARRGFDARQCSRSTPSWCVRAVLLLYTPSLSLTGRRHCRFHARAAPGASARADVIQPPRRSCWAIFRDTRMMPGAYARPSALPPRRSAMRAARALAFTRQRGGDMLIGYHDAGFTAASPRNTIFTPAHHYRHRPQLSLRRTASIRFPSILSAGDIDASPLLDARAIHYFRRRIGHYAP